MAGLCEGRNVLPGSLKAICDPYPIPDIVEMEFVIVNADAIEQRSSAQSTLGLASLTRGEDTYYGAAGEYALYLFLLHDGA
ncbi:hypothetical protein ANN_01851 [Periplaneta americana]|uniref:Uncharacterized protein n=1 Tax=Periplaneta americana TaxID=6978 RepID=A0ABQ8TWG0_PERAM|nr:hypothetical protein ANN_01851 [Periplaneta americana]